MATHAEINEQVIEKMQWYKSPKGKAYARKYRRVNKVRHAELKRLARQRQAERYPEKIKARNLVGNAVRMGFMKPPEESRNWHNKWQFHHPDYTRPYFGVWLTIKDHSAVHHGKMECPKPTDYTGEVIVRMFVKFGITGVTWKLPI